MRQRLNSLVCARHHVLGKPGNAKHWANTVNHGGGSTTGRLVRIVGKMTATMSRDIPDGNLLQSTLDLRLADGSSFSRTGQQDIEGGVASGQLSDCP